MTINPSLSVVNEFCDELLNAGVHDICISPGSRSAPLTMAVARNPRFRVWSLLDERSAGFFALGLARSVNRPVVLVCTSGTATANYLPALMEAKQARVPIIAITADRPPELRDTGSNQTVDQVKMFGSYVKWFVEMPVPDDGHGVVQHARATAQRATAMAMTAPAGPVHLNWPFREPLIPPRAGDMQAVDVPTSDASMNDGRFRRYFPTAHAPRADAVGAVADLLLNARRPLIVIGPQEDVGLAPAALALGEQVHCPVIADVLSQVRCTPGEWGVAIDRFDLMLRSPATREALQPDVIIRIGATPTSKVLGQYLQQQTRARHIIIDVSTIWRDPFHNATDVVQADPLLVCQQVQEMLAYALDLSGSAATERAVWLKRWTGLNDVLGEVADEQLRADALYEPRVFAELALALRDGDTVFVGNSMPVRDADMFFPRLNRQIRFVANRGASGIDGIASSAFGVAAGSAGRVILVVGDVSFYHDLNGLLAGSRHGLNLVIVLIHNDGGGIFSYLPQAEFADTFAQFQTSHGVDFRPAVEMFGGDFHTVASWRDFQDALVSALESTGTTVIELRTDTDENVRLHQEVYRLATATADAHVLMWR